jgi:hypothetical protein
VVSDLQCPVRVYVARQDAAHDPPAGIRLADVLRWTAADLADVRGAFDGLADRYRGETVLVVLDADGLRRVAEWSGTRAGGGRLVLECDADGWREG